MEQHTERTYNSGGAADRQALKELLRMWRLQHWRDFSWRTLFVAAYFAGLYVMVVVGIYMGLQGHDVLGQLPFDRSVLALLLAVAVVPADMLLKVIWRRSPVEMDDVLRSRPVSPRTWALFVLADTSVGFMQLMLPLAMAFVVALALPLALAALTFVVAYSATMVNALVQNCWRRAPGNEYTFPLLVGYLAWGVVLYAIVVGVFIVVGLAADDPSTPPVAGATVWGTVAGGAIIVAFNAVVGYVLHRYFRRMKNHNENSGRASHVQPLSDVTLASMDWTAVRRSKRLRMTLYVIAPIFLLNTYMQQVPQVIEDLGFNTMLLLGVAFPAVMLAQYGLGVEANYIHGIWTKPWPIEAVLRNKFRFYAKICGVMALLCLPAVVWMHMAPWTLLAVLLFSVGVFVLLLMPMCLYCSRFDLFTSAFFNYQGSNKQMNIYSFILFVPMGIYYAAYYFLPTWGADALMAALGIVGIALERPFTAWLARRWYARRHDLMERWTKD